MDLHKSGICWSYENQGQACGSHEVSIGIMDTGTHHWLTHVLDDMDVTISMTGYISPWVRIEMTMGNCLHIKNPEIEQRDYPACRIQKGLVFVHENKAVGFWIVFKIPKGYVL